MMNQKQRHRILAMLGAAGSLSIGAAAWAQPAPVAFVNVPFVRDSGPVSIAGEALGSEYQLAWSEQVTVGGAPWMRLYFDAASFAGDVKGGTGAKLVITSLLDGDQQFLNAESIKEWGYSSAYLNGDSVLIELFVKPGTGPSQISLGRVEAGKVEPPINPESICGTGDDRYPRSYSQIGRLMPVGCTGWTISNYNKANQLLTAGHCINNGQTGMVMQFNVPPSSAGGTPINPPVASQFPVDPASIQSTGDAGVGVDAATFNTFPNSNTRLESRIAQADAAIHIVAAPAANNQPLGITGYGTTSSPVSPTWNQMSKEHGGPLTGKVGTALRHRVDTTGGNSGSPIGNSLGQGIGIHTHGGCGTNGTSFNSGTDIAFGTLQSYLNSPKGYQAPWNAVSQEVLFTSFAGGNQGDPGGTIFFDVQTLTSQPLRINGFLLNIGNDNNLALLDDFYTFEVYVTPGGSAGKELDITKWKKVADGHGMPNPEGGASMGALKQTFELAQYSSYGIAIVMGSTANHAYTNGNGANEVYSNAELKITGKSAVNGKFNNGGNPIFAPRVFNGAICTTILPAQGHCEETYFNSNQFTDNGGMAFFDITTGSNKIAVNGMDVNIYSPGMNVECEIYTTPGGRAGKLTNPAAWTYQGKAVGIGATYNTPTHLTLNQHFALNANSTTGIAIKVVNGTSSYGAELSTIGGGVLGTLIGPDFTMKFGEASDTAFGSTAFTNVVWNGRLCYNTEQGSCGASPSEANQRPFNAALESRNSNTGLGGVSTQQIAEPFKMNSDWNFDRLWLYGVYLGNNSVPPAQSFTVNIYNHNASTNLPGSLHKTFTVNNVKPVDTGGFATGFSPGYRVYLFELNLPSNFAAQAGTTYWLSPLGNNSGNTFSWQFSSSNGGYVFRSSAGNPWTTSASPGSYTWAFCGQEVNCYADCDGSGSLTIDDFICFQTLFALGDPGADCDQSKSFTIDDFICFQTMFAIGC